MTISARTTLTALNLAAVLLLLLQPPLLGVHSADELYTPVVNMTIDRNVLAATFTIPGTIKSVRPSVRCTGESGVNGSKYQDYIIRQSDVSSFLKSDSAILSLWLHPELLVRHIAETVQDRRRIIIHT